MGKLGRRYSLIIGPTFKLSSLGGGTPPIPIDPTIKTIPSFLSTTPIPLSLEFDIERHNLSNAGHFTIKVHNLGENLRNFIRKDYSQTDVYKRCELKAGYGPVLPTIATGNISKAFSFRGGGETSYITQIEGFDGGFDYLNSDYNQSWGMGTPKSVIIADLTRCLNFIKPGVVGPMTLAGLPLTMGESYSGPTLEILKEVTGGAAFIDNQTLHVLADSECLVGTLPVITSASGLLGTPIWQNAYLTLDMMFEPRLTVGQGILLKSLFGASADKLLSPGNNQTNGPWKIVGLKHRGMISETVCGDAVTSLNLSRFLPLIPVGV